MICELHSHNTSKNMISISRSLIDNHNNSKNIPSEDDIQEPVVSKKKQKATV